jgi:pentapeptide repeat protein
MKPSRVRRMPCVGFALILALLGQAGPTDAAVAKCPRRVLDARVLAAGLARGEPVIRSNVTVRGDLELPADARAPLVLESSCLRGDLVGSHTSYSHVIDLSNTWIQGRVDFDGARFDAPVTLESAQIDGPASFELAVFDEAAHFDPAYFQSRADFSGSEFHGSSSFSGASWAGLADFSATRFERRANFAAAGFNATRSNEPSADFSRATFDDGATFFLATVEGRASFLLAASSDELSFQSLTVNAKNVPEGENALYFSTARLLGPVSFGDAEIHGRTTFDQAEVSQLELAGAALDGPLRLPIGPGSRGSLGALTLNLDDASRVVGPAGGDDRAAQEAALALVESTARASDDLETANDARVRRLTIAREGRGPLGQGLDYSFNYGLWGYGVRPYHQLLAIAFVLLLGVGIRWSYRRRTRFTAGSRARGALSDAGESFRSLLRLNAPERPWAIGEYLVFKVLVVVFVLNAANVWPVSRDLIQGIF